MMVEKLRWCLRKARSRQQRRWMRRRRTMLLLIWRRWQHHPGSWPGNTMLLLVGSHGS